MEIDEEEVIAATIDRVVCRWCERDDCIEMLTDVDPE